jgi:iron complex transport system substrate-binding protein
VSALAACAEHAAPPAHERIVSVAPNLTEMLFAAGAAGQVVAVSAYSDYPEAATRLPQVGDAFRLDFERIVALAPTVAVVWETGTPAGVAERLEALGIRVVSIPTRNLDEIATGVVALGELAGTQAVAARAAADYRARIAALRARYRGRPPVRVFVQIDDAPLFTVGGPHLITEILGLCGGVNVFADAGAQALPVDLEAVLARAPEVILSTDTDAPAPYWARFTQLVAVARGNLYQSNGDLLARPSPRIADGAADVCARLDEARAKRK